MHLPQMNNRDQLFKRKELEANLLLTHRMKQKGKEAASNTLFHGQLAKETTFTFESNQFAQDDRFSSFFFFL